MFFALANGQIAGRVGMLIVMPLRKVVQETLASFLASFMAQYWMIWFLIFALAASALSCAPDSSLKAAAPAWI